MLSDVTKQKISQERLNALVARTVYERRFARIRRRSAGLDLLSVAVPILLLAVRFVVREGRYAEGLNIVNEILAVLVVIGVVWKFISGWDDKLRKYAGGIYRNVMLVGEADDLITSGDSEERARGFFRTAKDLESRDREALELDPDSPEERQERQMAYREALKEAEPSNPAVECPKCHTPVWNYEPGTCQACGGGPTANAK